MFGKKKRISESFNVGNANMEIPDYEIKIEGQVPVTYATAINDRKETKKIINKKFEEKDKLTDEFIDENNDRLGDTDTMEIKESVESKIYKRAEKISSDIDSIAKDLARINYEDFISDKDLRQLTKAARTLEDFSVAYAHVMEDEDLFESDDNQSDADVCPECKKNPCICTESIADEKPVLTDTFVVSGIDSHDGRRLAVTVRYRKRSKDFAISETNANNVFYDSRLRFLSREAAEAFVQSFKENSNSRDSLRISPSRGAREVVKIETPYSDVADCYASTIYLDSVGLLSDEIQESDNTKKRTRSANTKKEDKLFSSDDLWLKVYDDLSSEVDNEGPNGEVNKEVKIPRGKRFIGPYAGPGDYDLTVYGKTMDDLKWAKKVADHYGVNIETKKDTNRRTNIYYPYTAILRNIR